MTYSYRCAVTGDTNIMFNPPVLKCKESQLRLLLIHFLLQCSHVAWRFRHIKIFLLFTPSVFLIISHTSPLSIKFSFFLPSPLSSHVLNFCNNSCSVAFTHDECSFCGSSGMEGKVAANQCYRIIIIIIIIITTVFYCY